MESEFCLIPFLCDRSSISLDIGANSGIYTFFMSKYSERVISFEPNLECLNKLRSRSSDNVTILFNGASDGCHVAELRYDPANTGTGTLDPRNALQKFERIDVTSFFVPAFPVDLLGLKDVAFIKMGVDGHESAVVQGAIKTLRRERPALLIERKNRNVVDAIEDVYSRLVAIGYSGYVLNNKSLQRVTSVDNGAPIELSTSNNYNFIFLHDDHRDEYRMRLSPRFDIRYR
jgi:FkbM family methyltransferase